MLQGAISVLGHLISPLSKPLFKRAISESGFPTAFSARCASWCSLNGRCATLAAAVTEIRCLKLLVREWAASLQLVILSRIVFEMCLLRRSSSLLQTLQTLSRAQAGEPITPYLKYTVLTVARQESRGRWHQYS